MAVQRGASAKSREVVPSAAANFPLSARSASCLRLTGSAMAVRPFQPSRAAFGAFFLALLALVATFAPVSAQKEDVRPPPPSLTRPALHTAAGMAWNLQTAY